MRAFIDIVEQNLPLRKGSHNIARDLKGAFIVVMRPIDFLRLTTSSQAQIDEIIGHDFTDLDSYRDITAEYNFTQYNMPFLHVIYPGGHVDGHEGRHRAGMVMRAGGKSFPCVVRFSREAQYFVTCEEDVEDDVINRRFGPLSYEDAKTMEDDLDSREGFWDVRLRTEPGGTMRKGPNGAWAISDMVPELVGQFDQSIRIPTSTMRFGLV